MKKMILVLGILFVTMLLTGCRGHTENDIIKDLQSQLTKASGYKLEGTLEILNNDDIYNYTVEVSFKRDDMYKVTLVNKANNHEQIILKNNEGVFVLTHKGITF